MVRGGPATPCSDKRCGNICNYHREELPGWTKKILGNPGAVCFCLGKEETFCSWLSEQFCLDVSTVWASECWSNPVHVMSFTQFGCQHKQAQSNLKRKRWKISHVIKMCLQMHLQLFLLHRQIMILSTLLLSWSRHFCNALKILQKRQSVKHNFYLNPSCFYIQMRMNVFHPMIFQFFSNNECFVIAYHCQIRHWRISVFAELVDRKVADPCLSVNWLCYLSQILPSSENK